MKPLGPTGSLLPNLVAGLTSGLVTLIYSISFAALVFSGRLNVYFSQGVGSALIGATLTAIIVAWRSPFPFTLAGPEANSAVLVALAASSIAGALDSPEREASVFPTIWATIISSSIVIGLFLYALGRFRLGRMARYIPYPVIGGFLAGTGWLILRASFKVMTGTPLGIKSLPLFFQAEVAAQWISGAAMAAILFFGLSRFKHFLTLPGLLFGCIALGNVAWRILQHAAPGLNREGWFFEPFSHEGVWQAWNTDTVTLVDWTVLMYQGGTLFAMTSIVMFSILLNSTGLELATSRSVDLDQELKANGVANILNGCFGGMVGYLSINRSLLNQKAGARSPAAGMIAGGVCAAALFLGSSFLAYVPKPVLGGLLLYIGSNLLFRWVYQAWFQFSRTDYLLIVVILIVIASLGFLQGVGAGTLIACVLFIVSYGKTSSIKYTLSGRSCQSKVSRSLPQQRLLDQEGDSITILVLHGFVFFGTANDLVDAIEARLTASNSRKLLYAVFDFRLVTGLDSSAAMSFMKLRQLAEKSGLNLVFTHMAGPIESRLRQNGLFSGEDSIVHCFADLDHGLEWCEDQILGIVGLMGGPATPLVSLLQSFLNDPESAATLMGYLKCVEVPEGQYLFRQGQPSDGLYFLESGRVSVILELPNGKTLRRGRYTSGTILGEMGLYAHAPRSASVFADQPSRLLYLSNQAFEQIESEDPQLASCFNRSVVNLVAQRLRRAEEEVRVLLR